MGKENQPPEMTEVLTTSHFAYLCTTDLDNQPHITPMFYIYDEKTNDLYLRASAGSKKMQNIQGNPKICLTIDIRDEINPFNNRGVMVQGKAVIEKTVKSLSGNEDEKLLRASKAFEKKYPVLLERHSPIAEYRKGSEILIRIAPQRMVYWRGPHFITVNFDKKVIHPSDL